MTQNKKQKKIYFDSFQTPNQKQATYYVVKLKDFKKQNKTKQNKTKKDRAIAMVADIYNSRCTEFDQITKKYNSVFSTFVIF